MGKTINGKPPAQIEHMLQLIHHLSEEIGGRGSCSQGEREAAEDLAEQLKPLGVQGVHIEGFEAISSTYYTYALAFGTAIAGTLTGILLGGAGTLGLSAILNGLGFWGMLSETNLDPSWMRKFITRSHSQNIVGKITAKGAVRKNVVVSAHIDTHRTPVFYSSKAWISVFSLLIGLTCLSMGLGAIIGSLGAVFNLSWARWFGLILLPFQIFALAMCLHADFSPYSPGANDNASGVAVSFNLAARLIKDPLESTQVHFVFTGCEEVGAWGMEAFLDQHANELGSSAFYIILDQVGSGRIYYLTKDGLLIKHPTHPLALQAAEQVVSQRPELDARRTTGLAYTDALKATKRKLIALTLCSVPRDGSASGSNWHRMSDTADKIIPDDLINTAEFVWQLLKNLDASSDYD